MSPLLPRGEIKQGPNGFRPIRPDYFPGPAELLELRQRGIHQAIEITKPDVDFLKRLDPVLPGVFRRIENGLQPIAAVLENSFAVAQQPAMLRDPVGCRCAGIRDEIEDEGIDPVSADETNDLKVLFSRASWKADNEEPPNANACLLQIANPLLDVVQTLPLANRVKNSCVRSRSRPFL